MKKITASFLSLFLFSFLLVACSSAANSQELPTVDVSAMQTQTARAVIADLTASAPTFTPPIPTQTTEPTASPAKCSSEDFTSPDWVMVNNAGTSEFLPTTEKIKIIANGGNQDLYFGTSMDAPRILKKMPSGDFEITTHVTIPENYPRGGFQAAGLLLYFNTQNYAWIALSAWNNVESAYTLMGNRKNILENTVPVNSNQYYLAFKTEGSNLFAGYSQDGINYLWSDAVIFDTSNIRAGLTVISAWEATGYSGEFDCFEYIKK